MTDTDLALLEGPAMARPKGRPKGVGATPPKYGVVKIERGLIAQAKILAGARKTSVAEYLSEILGPVLAREYGRWMRKLEQEGGEK